MPELASSESYLEGINAAGTCYMHLQLLRDNVAIAKFVIGNAARGSNPTAFFVSPSAIEFVDDNAPNGNHQYSIQIGADSSETLTINNVILRLSQE
jgi:hypothetical protein